MLTKNYKKQKAADSFRIANLLIAKGRQELQKETSPDKYLASPEVQEVVAETVYKDWLAGELKGYS